jgi:hypothetical protein
VFHGTDDGLSTFVDVHVLNDDAAMPEPGESFHLRRVGAQKLHRERSVRIIRGMTRDLYDPSLHPAGEQPSVESKGPPQGVILDSFAGPVHVEWDTEAALTPLGQCRSSYG